MSYSYNLSSHAVVEPVLAVGVDEAIADPAPSPDPKWILSYNYEK
jgi:hypothetical protein